MHFSPPKLLLHFDIPEVSISECQQWMRTFRINPCIVAYFCARESSLCATAYEECLSAGSTNLIDDCLPTARCLAAGNNCSRSLTCSRLAAHILTTSCEQTYCDRNDQTCMLSSSLCGDIWLRKEPPCVWHSLCAYIGMQCEPFSSECNPRGWMTALWERVFGSTR
ncbi:hypothetical protein EG68_01771 [Paragonimus skrjabini miyazakii]|uniref:Uncharacterized protein n=1 Tax=Paragonimus skrjabini miyazakii TaxID=59628 RepID=A0A8S9YZX1_9TREM|nr:hypothetical protein EG68_01771 [Paragonimus skrjabini miyazakii]